jgi:AraC family transcriptional regulator of adaptative response/methylated-DNA-[protein]-cysteine methyltransferase
MSALSTKRAWKAVMERDRRCDGIFVYAVASTMVYCRPSCPSRKPHRRHVTFFRSAQLAEGAGFRACRRCRPESSDVTEIEKRIELVRRHLDEHSDATDTLQQLASLIGMSPYYLQRTFKELVGLSPKEYRDARRMERFKTSLKRGQSVSHAIYEAGFGSSSRLYERVNSDLGMTPSVFQSGGTGVILRFMTTSTAVGRMLVAVTDRGIATVRLGESDASLLASLRRDYPMATLRRDAFQLKRYTSTILRSLTAKGDGCRAPLDPGGTVFQRRVWKALQRIPRGSTCSYSDVAQALGQPAAARAVARACATNPIAIAIPCHRVIRADGRPGGYRWGLHRKHRLLALEQKISD